MPNKPITPTTLQILMNDWLALRKIITEITVTRNQKKPQAEEGPYTQLTERQINDAFYGPYHDFIQSLSQTYVLISRLRTHLTISHDENLKPHVNPGSFESPMPINKDINVAMLDKLQRELDTLTNVHFTRWQEHAIHWRQQIILKLTMHEINLSDLEIDDLTQPEALSELLDRFTELNLALPATHGNYYDFSDFLRCKTLLCLHSAFNRQHKSHIMDDLKKTLKQLKDDFKQIEKEQKRLLEILKKEVAEITKPLQ